MNSNRLKSMSLVAALAGSIVVGIAACSGGGGGSSTTPTPSPTANPANECDVVFSGDSVTTGKKNYYIVNMIASDWSNGTKTITVGSSGDPSVDAIYPLVVYNYLSTATPKYEAIALATNGTFTLGSIPATNGLAKDATFTFTQSTSLKFFDEFQGGTGMEIASNGTGSVAAGVLSDPAAFDAGSTLPITPFDGSVTVNLFVKNHTMAITSALNIGGTGNAYAGCFYFPPAFAPETPADHAVRVIENVLRNRN